MAIDTNVQKIEELLTRGVEETIVKDDLRKKLTSGKQLRIKLGIDPTSPHLHLGRAVCLLKLRDFQQLGHQVVFIVGDFTGVIGDTSDKDSERPMLSREVIEKNMQQYVEQAGKIIDIQETEIHYNSEWLEKLTYREIGEQADQFSLAEFSARDNIRRRLNAGTRVSLREILYPLMQGYDSVAIKADVELGGVDQRFNLLAGRTLQEYFKQIPQNILMNPLLEGTDGRKMSSSWGNTITLDAEPNEKFGKIMTVQDELLIKYFELTTRVSLDEIGQFKKQLAEGLNPKDLKMKLAYELVKFYHSGSMADEALHYFKNVFENKQKPIEIPELKPSAYDIISILVESKIAKSKSDARKLVEQGGVKINDEKVVAIDVTAKAGDVVQKGSRFFVKVA